VIPQQSGEPKSTKTPVIALVLNLVQLLNVITNLYLKEFCDTVKQENVELLSDFV